ncbi:phage gp6-like head-tail connector protein [Candidatus Dependentiae bacterium]|nr:MAG: phage gp6-like head-tail connector protein [Candidatus Dependentiae bacterium]
MLATLAEVKSYLGETTTTYDAFLTQQITMISEAIEQYCQRTFLEDTYVQTYYKDDFTTLPAKLPLYHYPVATISQVKQDDAIVTEVPRLHKPTGMMVSADRFFLGYKTLEITYTAGFLVADVPSPIKNVVYALCEEKYNRKKSGISLNFGSDVQRISIAGSISIDYDYSLNNNERANGLGTILGSHLNVLDAYRSERRLMGSSVMAFVE